MTMSHRLSVSLIAAALVASSLLPASAAELPIPPKHKVATAASSANKPARHRLIKIASAAGLPSSRCRMGCSIPLILGVAY